MGYIWPLDPSIPVSQPFGSSPGGYNPVGGHTGTDFAAPAGTPVRAIGDGRVTFADWASTLPADYRADGSGPNPYWLAPGFGGIVVAIDHGPAVSIYAHLSKTDLNVGDRVIQGQIIAYTGNTGGATSGPHLHFETLPDGWDFNNGTYGRVNPSRFCGGYWTGGLTVVPASSSTQLVRQDQRVTAAEVNVRDAATTSGKVVGSFAGDTILDFKGYVRGEAVDGNNVWFVGAYSGNFIWSGGFKDKGAAGLFDLTPALAPPKPAPAAQGPQPFQRVTGPSGANLREAPDKNAAVVKTFDPDLMLDFKGYVRATDPYGDGNNVWFVGAYSNTYAWSGAFTDASTKGLKDITPTSAPAPSAPVVAAYDFELDITEVIREDGVVVKVEKYPAHIGNLQLGVGNRAGDHAVIHQFGTLNKDTFESTGNQFAKEGTFVSAYHSVSGRRIRQHVALKDRAYHAAATGNDWYGMETDPAQDYETVLTARALLLAVDAKRGRKLAPIRHRDVPGCATSCGAVIDLARYDVTFPVAPAPAPPVGPAPAPPALDEAGVLRKFFDWIIQLFMNRKVS